ncbi:MAG TPA: glycoside hydrolase family 2 TIM barrel-domain containing protein, partial [Chthoniobacterales bacterium]|nr:glycoside hydrolase family 2 TIM barrel-domain containing protein [Chthoniobacterales bacterium]
QPYPTFYLDVADEMGIMVLDESAVWASDGGPKLDDPRYWASSERDQEALVKRDRNHPAVFGWSVSNEVHPIVMGVMRNPPGMMDELVKHYGIWRDICHKFDPTRPWVSSDGEDDGNGNLPTYVVHYGGNEAMDRAFKSGKPWGVGEAGMAYYGTPEQTAKTNGDRSYESFLGRMESVAVSSYESLVMQRENHATYRSVFNLVWYGLQPLPLGLKDVTKAPTLQDGVFFTHFEEGQPGVQPERLGPYCTTLNPGYDPSLPLYKTWPLFEAIRDAATEPLVKSKWASVPAAKPEPKFPAPAPVLSAKVFAGKDSKLAVDLTNIGVPLAKLSAAKGVPQVLFIDGAKPPTADGAVDGMHLTTAGIKAAISQVINAGGTVVVWGADSSTLPALNALLPAALEVGDRESSSLLPVSDALTAGMTPSSLYFSEQRPSEFTEKGLGGPLIEQSKVLLKANDTNWERWNKQAEYAKTAMVIRSELEAKPPGVVLAEKTVGKGRLLVTTLPAAPRLIKGEKATRGFLTNLGFALGSGMDAGKPLLKNGTVVRMLANGYFPVPSVQEAGSVNPVSPTSGDKIRAGAKVDGKEWKMVYEENGGFKVDDLKLPGFQNNVEAWFSFWVYSPRDLTDLLLEPNLPRVNFETIQNDSAQVWLNGSMVIDKLRTGPPDPGQCVAKELKLKLGWNHILIKLVRAAGGWDFSAKFTSNQPEFLSTMDSSLEKP